MIIVHIWTYSLKGVVKSSTNVGHSALSIPTSEPHQNIYISWWPGGEGNLADPHLFIEHDFFREGDHKRNVSGDFKKMVNLIGRLAEGKSLSNSQTEFLAQNFSQQERQGMTSNMEVLKDVSTGLKKGDWYTLASNTHNRKALKRNPTEQDKQYKELLHQYTNRENLTYTLLPPDDNFHIPTLADKLVGLDSCSMMNWWLGFVDLADVQKNYRFHWQNCSTIVYRVLVAGGAKRFGVKSSKLVKQPRKIKERCQILLIRLAEMNRKIEKFVNGTLPPNAENMNWAVWSSREWQRRSSVLRAHRYSELKKIDRHLQAYHAVQGNENEGPVAAKKMWELGEILVTLHDIVTRRPTSKRMEAILSLGCQAIGELKRLQNLYKTDASRITNTTYWLHYDPLL